MLRRAWVAAALIVLGIGWVGLGVYMFTNAEEELMPNGDRSFVVVWVTAPEGSTVDYMERYQRQAEKIVIDRPESKGVLSVIALGIGTPGVVTEGLVFAELVSPSDRDVSQESAICATLPHSTPSTPKATSPKPTMAPTME